MNASTPLPDDTTARRAQAAERTVDVLKKKVFELYNGGSQSALHKQLEKARRREDENRRKRELVEVRANELKRYSETLELEVARRTEAIKTILDNVTFGFLVVGRDLVVQPESTRSCRRLFGTEQVEGANLGDLLGLRERARQTFFLSADQVFEDILPAEVSLAQMQQKFVMPSGSTLQVEGGVVRDREGAVAALLLTISDITALEAATRESDRNRALVGILSQKESFRTFLQESKQQLVAAARGVATSNQAMARHAIHTIKGNSASYGMNELVETIHAIEECPELLPAHVRQIEGALREFLEGNRGVLEVDFDKVGDEGFEVTREQMSKLKSLLSAPIENASELERWAARVSRRSAWQLLGPIDDFAQKLATRLGKNVAVQVTGGDTVVDGEVMRPVFQVVAHLVRNAIDHGIEPPIERKQKPTEGRLDIACSVETSSYVLRFDDDGRGIDVDILGRRALQMGVMTDEGLARASYEEKLALVFVDGLSSAPVTTNISGRGVGMSAVKAAVDRAGGTLHLSSTPGRGTTLVLRIPKTRDAS